MQPTATSARPLVLIVDDVPEAAEIVAVSLGEDYQFLIANSGIEAIEIAMAHEPEVMLLDVNMPGMDGHQVLATMRSHAQTSSIPVIFWTTRRDGTEFECFAIGAADFVPKTAPFAVIRARLANQIKLGRAEKDLVQRNLQLQAEVEHRRIVEENYRGALEDLKTFSYSLSHDLRAPLSAIGAYAGAIIDKDLDALPERSRGWLRKIAASVARANRMVDDILECMHVDRCALRREAVDLNEIASDIAEDRSQLWTKAQIHIGSLPVVSADRTMVRLILMNLIDNALKFSSGLASPRIEVSARRMGNASEISVTDNGVGFQMESADSLFELFNRGHRPSDFPGSGVGLAIVKRMVVRHGGIVHAVSVPEKTTFAFTLPALA